MKKKNPCFPSLVYLLHVIRQHFRVACVKMIDNISNVKVMLKKSIDYSFYVKMMPHLVIRQRRMSQPLKLMQCGPLNNNESG